MRKLPYLRNIKTFTVFAQDEHTPFGSFLERQINRHLQYFERNCYCLPLQQDFKQNAQLLDDQREIAGLWYKGLLRFSLGNVSEDEKLKFYQHYFDGNQDSMMSEVIQTANMLEHVVHILEKEHKHYYILLFAYLGQIEISDIRNFYRQLVQLENRWFCVNIFEHTYRNMRNAYESSSSMQMQVEEVD